MKHTVAIVDGGGRGAVLAYKYAKSPHVGKIIAIPGNDLMSINSSIEIETHPDIRTTDVKKIVDLCIKEKVSLVDVAQDNAVAAGLTDALLEKGIKVMGPTKIAGELEWNKSFAREFMKKYNIPQPEFFVFTKQNAGIKFLSSQKNQAWFVKASGLAEGKGALPAKNNKEATERIRELSRFGESGKTYLLERWLMGKSAEEFSAFFISDGENLVFLGAAQDHKRALNFDEGENTGGMGCVSRPGVVTTKIQEKITEIAKKTINCLKKEGREYKGILYIGGMVINERDIYVIEYNARWGDPEAQVIIPSIKSDFFDLAMDVVSGKLSKKSLRQDKKMRLVITASSKGYPDDYSEVKGKEIFGLEEVLKNSDVLLFGAGVRKVENRYLVNGGRIFYVVSEGRDILQARERGYSAISKVFVEGNKLNYRNDIGYKDMQRFYDKKIKTLAILISNAGSGSNLQAIIDAINSGKLKAKIKVVVSDKNDAEGLAKAKKNKIPMHIFQSSIENLGELLTKKYPVDFVVLTGWKKIIPDEFIEMFENKILNIHPGLIPDKINGFVKNPDGTKGLWNRGKFTQKAIMEFIQNGSTYAGSSVHFLSKEFDYGEVLERTFEKIEKGDTVESLYERLKKKEHKSLIKALQNLSI